MVAADAPLTVAVIALEALHDDLLLADDLVDRDADIVAALGLGDDDDVLVAGARSSP